ncbi:retrovirus-related pol polyprotein from transposon TNT 1-94 [Tanacetum coccineum]
MDYQCTQAEEIERQREYERLEIEREKSMQEFTDMFKDSLERMNIQRKEEEKRIFEEAARQEEEKRISKEKEAAELEAKRKSQECLNIEEKSIPQASICSRKSQIDPTLSNFTISTKRIPFSTVETVNSLKIGDKHLDTQKGSLEPSVKDPIPIPRESDIISDGDYDDDYHKRFDLKVQQLWMPSIYDENNKIRECYIIRPFAITPDLPIPDSLIIEDEHLDTISVTESANTIKSSVEDLVPTPSESADLSNGESECDVLVGDESSLTFATFSNPLFDSKDDFTSSDDESLSDEDVPKENFKIYSNPKTLIFRDYAEALNVSFLDYFRYCGQFCDGGLEVAFRQHSCHIRNYDMVDLLNGSRTTNLYSISLNDMMSASPVCLLTKASSTKSWLWHRRLNHLNFGTLNELARNDLVRGLPMLKYDKDHLCPSCQLGKSKKASHPLKTTNTNTEVLHTLHMDLCGPMRSENQRDLNRLCSLRQNKIMERSSVKLDIDGWFECGWYFHETSTLLCYTLNRSLASHASGKTIMKLLKGKETIFYITSKYLVLMLYLPMTTEDVGLVNQGEKKYRFRSEIRLYITPQQVNGTWRHLPEWTWKNRLHQRRTEMNLSYVSQPKDL